MTPEGRVVRTPDELLKALASSPFETLTIAGVLSDLATLHLPPGVRLQGEAGATLAFAAGQDGVRLSADNAMRNLRLHCDPDRRALFNDTGRAGFGRLVLETLTLRGAVRLLLQGEARGGHVEAHDIDVKTADARAYPERPAGFGVEVIPAAFTIWNRQPDPASRLTADLTGIRVGRPGAPVRGGGVFVGGQPGGGSALVRRLETGEVDSDGAIASGVADRISGGVFVVIGAWVDEVVNRGPVTTYGVNDMVLDNWGSVERWTAHAAITSYGANAIGFVNFGDLGELKVLAPVQTFGGGARGFNVYAGTLRSAEFDRVTTHGDGAVGVQISRPVGRIAVERGIETFGGRGPSLVKGVVVELPAAPLSVKPGGSAREIVVRGGLVSRGEGVEALELHGTVERLEVSGGFGPAGAGFAPI